jgi:hypothetical protein
MNLQVIKFYNNTFFEVIISSYPEEGLPATDFIVKAYEQKIVKSRDGHFSFWSNLTKDSKNIGFESLTYIGTFRTYPCIFGEYGWLDNNNFEIKYFRLNNNYYDLIEFSHKN